MISDSKMIDILNDFESERFFIFEGIVLGWFIFFTLTSLLVLQILKNAHFWNMQVKLSFWNFLTRISHLFFWDKFWISNHISNRQLRYFQQINMTFRSDHVHTGRFSYGALYLQALNRKVENIFRIWIL